jgi:hypothetical protein
MCVSDFLGRFCNKLVHFCKIFSVLNTLAYSFLKEPIGAPRSRIVVAVPSNIRLGWKGLQRTNLFVQSINYEYHFLKLKGVFNVKKLFLVTDAT